MTEQSCPLNAPDSDQIEVITIRPETRVSDYHEALELAKEQATERLKDFMLTSWYDRDRDFESPPHTTESGDGSKKDGYIHYAMSHGARLKVDIEESRFVFFFTPVEW